MRRPRTRAGVRPSGASRGLAAIAASTLTVAPALFCSPAAAVTPGACAASAKTPIREVPWAQRALAPQRAWVLTQGGGLVVAVVDTGVSAASPSLAGAVLPGRDVTTNHTASSDCSGHGTFVAGLLAAHPSPGSGFAGLAPKVRVLPIRVATDESQVDPGRLAAGIRSAVDGGARVITVALGTATAPPVLHDAVAYASAHDALVVASTDAPGLSSGGPIYPAALPDVVAVASIGSDGRATNTGGTGGPPALAAPGSGLVSIAPRGGGNVTASGSGVAVAFVAATAALVRDYRPGLTAAQVRHRLETTADHPSGRLPDPLIGYGIVAPVAAVATELPEESKEPASQAQTRPIRIARPAPEDRRGMRVALIVSAAVVGCAALGGLVAGAVLRGRRRGWKPATSDDAAN